MTITAKYASRCATCGQSIHVGERIEWSKGSPARHTTCSASASANSSTTRSPRTAGPTKSCWECGCTFTAAEARRHGGDWQDSYCGC